MKSSILSNLKRLISLTICFVFIFGYVPTIDVSAKENIIDFEEFGLEQFTCSQNGNVKIKASENNKFLSISPKIDGVTTFIEYVFVPTAGATVELGYDFIIDGPLNNGTTIALISEGISEFLRVEVKDGSLVYKKSDGVYIDLINSFFEGRWYNLKLKMDFENNTYDVYIDNVCVLKNQTSLANYSFTSLETKLTLSTKYTPGFSIDNLYTENTKPLKKLFIEGSSQIKLAEGYAKTEEYVVNAYDYDGILIEDITPDCLLKPEGNGVSASIEGNKITLEILDTAEGAFELFAISGSMVKSKSIKIERYKSVPESLEILGDGKIAYGYNDNTYPFTVKAYDQQGNALYTDEVYYRLEGDTPAGLQLDGDTGIITVTEELPKDYNITLKAVYDYNPEIYATKTLVLEDSVTYYNDQYVFNILKNHIENVYTYAADTWNGTPLLAQAIDLLSLTPARWYETPERSFVPSNQAAISQFQRACDAIYIMTGEEKYRARIDESNKYFFENFVNEGGLPYWGGHVYIDLETGKENREEPYTKNCHENKGHDPYMDSFYRVAPETSTRFIISNYINHIKDWNTMDLSRHGFYDEPYDESKFTANTSSYTPSNKGYSPAYTTNLGFASTLYGFARLSTDMYKHTKDERAATGFMKIFDAFWRVASPDPDYWLDVDMNTTAGRKGYPDEAVQGLNEITVNGGKWWLLDPVPDNLQWTGYGDRYWRARGDDLIDQGFITPEEQWKVRECYIVSSPKTNPPILYWEFIDAIGEDHPYAETVRERAVRNVANYIRMAYVPEDNNFKVMLIDGTDLTGFVCKRAGYYGGIGQVYNRTSGGTALFATTALTYSRALKYPQYKEQCDIMWDYIKRYAESKELGIFGDNAAGDAGTNLNLSTGESTSDFILASIYLYDATGNVQFLDLARAIARNYVDGHEENGFLVATKGKRYLYTGGDPSNDIYILALLEAAIRGVYDQCPAYVQHEGFYESYLYLEETGGQNPSGNEYQAWGAAMPRVELKEINILKDEIELRVGETYTVEYTVYPNDAGDKGVNILSSDLTCVTADLDSRTIQAVKPGTAEVILRGSSDFMIYDTLKVIVTE